MREERGRKAESPRTTAVGRSSGSSGVRVSSWTSRDIRTVRRDRAGKRRDLAPIAQNKAKCDDKNAADVAPHATSRNRRNISKTYLGAHTDVPLGGGSLRGDASGSESVGQHGVHVDDEMTKKVPGYGLGRSGRLELSDEANRLSWSVSSVSGVCDVLPT